MISGGNCSRVPRRLKNCSARVFACEVTGRLARFPSDGDRGMSPRLGGENRDPLLPALVEHRGLYP